jgi:hypothetical protein
VQLPLARGVYSAGGMVEAEQLPLGQQPALAPHSEVAAPAGVTTARERDVAVSRPVWRLCAHIGSIVAGWREAWLTRRDNPLCAAWELAEARRGAAWRKRRAVQWRIWRWALAFAYVAYLVGGLIYALDEQIRRLYWETFIGEFYSLLLGSWLSYRWEERYEMSVPLFTVALVLGLTIVPAIVAAGLWLIMRFWGALQTAFGFLEREARNVQRHVLDDLVAVAPLTEQAIVLACSTFCMRKLLRPFVLLLAFTVSFGMLAFTMESWLERGEFPGLTSTLLLFASTVFAMLLVSALLVSGALVLVAMSLSLTPRSGVWPSLGALAMLALQIASWFVYISSGGTVGHYYSFEPPPDYAQLGLFAGLTLAVMGLLLYIARRSSWLRLSLTAAFPFVVLSLMALMTAGLMFNFDDYFSSRFFPGVGAVQLFTVITPSLIRAGADQTSGSAQVDQVGKTFGYWLTLLPYQCLFLLMAAEFARDAVRRRKWSAA